MSALVLSPRARTALRLLLVVAAVLLIAEQAWQLVPPAVGCDFVPLRHAAQALLDGASVYRDPSFVYPPTAALILLPTAALSETAAFGLWLALIAAALAL